MNNQPNNKEDALTLEILEVIESESHVTQRHIADKLGVALGLANSYLKRCIRKGLIKVQKAPANRYLYYITPKGFAEKGRLTAQYLSFSFEMYRRASKDYGRVMHYCRQEKHNCIVLLGVSELAEIALLRAHENGITVSAIHDPGTLKTNYMKLPVVADKPMHADASAAVLTAMNDDDGCYGELIDGGLGLPVIVPDFLSFMNPAR